MEIGKRRLAPLWILAAALAALALAALALAPRPAMADEVQDGYYNILWCGDQDLALGVESSSTGNKTPVELQAYDESSEAQKWRISRVSAGLYEISPALGEGSSLVMDVASGKFQNKSALQVYKSNGSAGQRFFMQRNANGSWTFVPQGGTAYAVDKTSPSAPGTNAYIYSRGTVSTGSTTLNQQFMLRESNLPGMEYPEAAVGDKLVYTVTQKVNKLGSDAFVRYRSMYIEDTVPDGLEYVSARLLNDHGVDLTPSAGKLSYDESARKVRYDFSSEYLSEHMALSGESYTLEITTRISEVVASGEFRNVGHTSINGVVLDSNEVVTPILEPNVVKTKKVDSAEAYVGKRVHYTLTVSQSVKGAAAPADDYVDDVPAELALDASSVRWSGVEGAEVTVDGQRITVSPGRLQHGKTLTVEYDATVLPSAVGKDELKNVFADVYVPVEISQPVTYYRDGEKLYADYETSCSENYEVLDSVTAKAARPNCDGLDCWYLDEACTVKYDPAVNGKKGGGFNLYSRNRVTLDYRATNTSYFLTHDKDFFLDEALERPMSSSSQILPASELHWYGETVTFASGADVYYDDLGLRRLACSEGAYLYADASGEPVESATLTANSVAYLHWKGGGYDGVYSR